MDLYCTVLFLISASTQELLRRPLQSVLVRVGLGQIRRERPERSERPAETLVNAGRELPAALRFSLSGLSGHPPNGPQLRSPSWDFTVGAPKKPPKALLDRIPGCCL
jgi:hypothetical protein